MRIEEFSKGDHARLVSFNASEPGLKRRLLSLGLTVGTEIKVLRFAPLGCPVQVDVRGTWLTLRKEEVSQLEWDRL